MTNKQEQAKEYYRNNKDKWKNCNHSDNRLLRVYGITVSDYDKMLKHQNYKCKICKKDERAMQSNKIKRLSVDHDHNTGKIRGLLCHSCNVRLSFVDKYNKQINKYLEG